MSSGAEVFGRLVLDTSAYSHLRRGHEGVLDHLARAELIVVPVIVLGELEAGFVLGERSRENSFLLSQFLAEPFVTVRDLTPSVSRHYARVFGQLRRKGRPIPINDVWIAAATLDCGGHLLTLDENFALVEGLDCTILSPVE
ncbi:MAG TPA: type II toxin-antitoxin system VapC family toxin [Thermoanaerobaculia bacterium]|nr:type II toxin-antitoxin system VapC family toxin [Thermoanaerobaculia bacterium]